MTAQGKGGSKGTCPHCGSDGLIQTIDSRDTALGRRRMRQCAQCKHRWSTVEMPAELADRLGTINHASKGVDRALRRAVARLEAARASLKAPPEDDEA